MATNFPTGFRVGGSEPIDTRLVMTREQMYDAYATMPQYYITICADGPDAGKLYLYDRDAPVDDVYGNFRQLTYTDLEAMPTLAELGTDDLHRTVTMAQIAAWDAKADAGDLADVALTGSYSDLTGRPVIPTSIAELSQDDQHLTVTAQEKQAWTQGANAIEVVKVDGTPLEIAQDKSVNISLSGKVDKVVGMGLSHADYTQEEKDKLSGIAPGAQVNVIEAIKVNGVTLAASGKAVNIDITGKVDKVVGKGLSSNDYTDEDAAKLEAIENGAQANVIETVKVNGTPRPVSSKAVDIAVPTKVSDLTNDSGYITTAVTGLTNYYDKSEIDEKYAVRMQFKTYPSLEDVPQAERNSYTIYLVPSSTSRSKNAKDEYIWNAGDSAWELIGSTTMKLDIVQDTTKIEINGDSLQEASSARPGLMTAAMYSKLDALSPEAGANVQSDWSEDDPSSDAYILNKPQIPTALSDLTGDATHRLVTDTLLAKLDSVETGAEANVIDTVKVDGAALPITEGAVDIDLSGKVDKAEGYGLSKNDFTDSLKAKLDAIEAGAQANVIEGITIRGTAVPPVNGIVDIDIDMSSKVDKVAGMGLSSNDYTDEEKDKLEGVENGAQVNVIETVRVDGTVLPVSDRTVEIALSETVREMLQDYDPKTMSISAWDPELMYNADAVVVRNSSLYIALQDNSGEDPLDESSEYWAEVIATSSSSGATTTAISAMTYQFGNSVDLRYTIPHRFQSYDFIWSLRTTDSERRYVQADVYATSVNAATVVLDTPPGPNGLVINLMKCMTTTSRQGTGYTIVSTPATKWYLENTTGNPMFVQAFRDPDLKIIGCDILQENEENFNPVTIDFGDMEMTGFMVHSPTINRFVFENEYSFSFDIGEQGYYAIQVVSETDGEGVVYPDIFQSNGTVTISFGTGPSDAKTGYVSVAKPARVVWFEDQSTWTYTHNLGRYVGVQAYIPEFGMVSSTQAASYNDDMSTCHIEFDEPLSGYMIVI